MDKEKDGGTNLQNEEDWRKLARVLGAFMARVGTAGFTADTAVIRLQAAMDGNLIVSTPPLPSRPEASTPPLRATQNDRSRRDIMDRATRYVQRGQLDRAIAEYRKILAHDPGDLRALLRIGDLYTRMDNESCATDAYLKVADAYTVQGFYIKAVSVYKQILKRVTNRPDINLKLAELYRMLGMIDDYVEEAERAVFFRPDDLATQKALAVVYLARKDGKRALQKLQLLFRAEPTDAQVLEMLAEAFLMLGQIGKVRQVREELRKVYESEGRTAEAKRIAVLIEHMPVTLDNVLEEVRVLEKHECRDQAVKLLTRFVALLRRENQFDDYLIAADRLVELTNDLKRAHELIRLREKGSFAA